MKKRVMKMRPTPGRYVSDMHRQYMETALWSSNDESDENGGDPMDSNYSVSDITKKTQAIMLDDCQRFYEQNESILDEGGWDAEQTGHDFWLTRNRHGVGFWDRDLGDEKIREALTEAAHKFGEVNLFVNRGKISQG